MSEPSRLVLLEQVHSIQAGAKVRFLGCVHAYDGIQAQLTLRCSYPATESNNPTVIVKIDNVLETINHELLQTGAWINVVGYVANSQDPGLNSKTQSIDIVAATMIWSAGAIKLDRYESAVQAFQKRLVAG